jgi:hypothetical protein
MMKQEGNKQHRFYRPRRPGGAYGDGLALEGVTSKFGLIGIGMLMAVGIAMLLIRSTPKESELAPVAVTMQASPYRTPKLFNSVLLPLTGARVMALDPATFAAADSIMLFSLKKGDNLNVWLTRPEAERWNEGRGRKDFYKALMLQKSSGEWIVTFKAYQKKAERFGSQGWWLIGLGVLLIPYQLLRKPKIPVWIALGVFLIVLLVWNFL